MKILLAGMNIDLEALRARDHVLRQLAAADHDSRPAPAAVEGAAPPLPEQAARVLNSYVPTPETISAAYARISRDPRPVPMLRRIAAQSVQRARRSNESIVYGMGHASIAEHAVFNVDVLDVSRLAAEELQRHRLISFTEKSQRYIRLDDGWLVPASVQQAGLTRPWSAFMRGLFQTYQRLVDVLETDGSQADGEDLAREDARYVLPLATLTQMGMTVNARNLELLIRRLAGSLLPECQEIARALLTEISPHVPSLIRYTVPRPGDLAQDRGRPLAALDAGTAPRFIGRAVVRLLSSAEDSDAAIAQALAFAREGAAASPDGGAGSPALIREALKLLGPHDAVPREFEFVHYLFEAEMSASCYAQLKRHRMMTVTVRPYDPALGLTLPDSIARRGLADDFAGALAGCSAWHLRLEELGAGCGAYALTNAHRRRALLQMNLRELYHFSRLRQDAHAQWEIRDLAEQMTGLVQAAGGVSAALLSGKDRFADAYGETFGVSGSNGNR